MALWDTVVIFVRTLERKKFYLSEWHKMLMPGARCTTVFQQTKTKKSAKHHPQSVKSVKELYTALVMPERAVQIATLFTVPTMVHSIVWTVDRK
jgi:hypothetical protein